jgi:hypothetical protein
MSEPMSFKEFEEMVKHIEQEHSPLSWANGKVVKYIDPHFDMRDKKVFSVTFRGFGWEKNFNCANENRELKDSLFKRCMDFLGSA